MLIHLDKSVAKILESRPATTMELLALECLALAMRKGSHLITGDRDALAAAAKAEGLGLPAKKAYEKAIAKVTQLGSAKSLTTTYAVIGDFNNGISTHNSGKTTTILIPLNLVSNLELQTPCEIVFEDLNDKHIYEIISSWHKNIVLKAPYLPLQYRSVHGGGNRTHAVYDTKQQQETTFCLCITDTDKKFPTDIQGPTSTNVANIENHSKPLSKHLNLDFQEIENLVPLSFLKKHSNSKDTEEIIELLRIAESNGFPESKLYWDYKKGITARSLKACQNKMRYWSTALAPKHMQCANQCDASKCGCFVIKPWSNKQDIKSDIEQHIAMEPDECSTLQRLWSEIGTNLVSWSIASTPQLA